MFLNTCVAFHIMNIPKQLQILNPEPMAGYCPHAIDKREGVDGKVSASQQEPNRPGPAGGGHHPQLDSKSSYERTLWQILPGF